MKGRVKEEGMDSHMKMLLHLIGIYIFASLQANGKLPHGAKQYYSPEGEGDTSPVDTERSWNTAKAGSMFKYVENRFRRCYHQLSYR